MAVHFGGWEMIDCFVRLMRRPTDEKIKYYFDQNTICGLASYFEDDRTTQ